MNQPITNRIDDIEEAHLRALRIEVAKDVLAQLKLKSYIANGGSYIEFVSSQAFLDMQSKVVVTGTLDLQQAIPAKCEVCAIGASLLSFARLYDSVPVVTYEKSISQDDSLGRGQRLVLGNYSLSGAPELLAEKLGASYSAMIEAAFEGWSEASNGHVYDNWNWELEPDRWPARYGSDGSEQRMKAIMKNVIKHDGEFVPESDYLQKGRF